MANRIDWNVLNQKIEKLKSENDILDTRSKALIALSVSTILDIDLEEAIDSITDGSHDRGIDALFIDDRYENNIHIFQIKCVNDFKKSKNNFPSVEIDKVSSFLHNLLDEDMDSLKNVNSQLKNKIQDTLDAQKKPNAKFFIHFVGNTAPMIEDEMLRVTANFRKYSAVTFEMHDLDKLSDYFLDKKTPSLTRKLKVIDTNFFERSDLNVRSLVCSVAASDIVDAIRSDDDRTVANPNIFDQNVRVYLKQKNKINKSILESATSDQNHLFWYQNNGITMTCDKLEVAPAKRSPEVELTNIQIINGGQTSNSLFDAAKNYPDKIDDVIILVRIIETTDEEVKNKIVETTNSQTPINVRDLRSNDRSQRQIEEAFLELGYFYERKAAQYMNEENAKRIDAQSAGQAYLSYFVGWPEVSKKNRGRVFGDLYDTVFPEDITAEKLLISYKLIQLINDRKTIVRKKIRDKKELKDGEISIIDGAFHILFALRYIIEKNKKDIWNINDATKYIDKAIKLISRIYLDAVKSEGITFSSNRFFKEAATRDKIIVKVSS